MHNDDDDDDGDDDDPQVPWCCGRDGDADACEMNMMIIVVEGGC